MVDRDPLTDKIYGALMMHHQETLRDQFAMAAPAEDINEILRLDHGMAANHPGYFLLAAQYRYLFADAMLEARTTEGQKP